MLSSAVCWETLERQLTSDGDGSLVRLFRDVVCKHIEVTRQETTTIAQQSAALDQVCNIPAASVGCSVVASQTGLPHAASTPVPPQPAPTANTLLTMEAILDYSTHLRYFPVPLAPSLATFLVAKDDLYIPRDNVTDVRALWPGECVAVVT